MSMEWYLNGELLKDNEAYEYLTMKRKMLISLRDHMQEKTATISDGLKVIEITGGASPEELMRDVIELSEYLSLYIIDLEELMRTVRMIEHILKTNL